MNFLVNDWQPFFHSSLLSSGHGWKTDSWLQISKLYIAFLWTRRQVSFYIFYSHIKVIHQYLYHTIEISGILHQLNIHIAYWFVVFRCGTLPGHTSRSIAWNTSQSPAPLPPQPSLWTRPHHHGNGSGWSDRRHLFTLSYWLTFKKCALIVSFFLLFNILDVWIKFVVFVKCQTRWLSADPNALLVNKCLCFYSNILNARHWWY